MRKFSYLAFDLTGIIVMLILALYLRNGPALIEDGQPNDLLTLLSLTLVVSLSVLPLMNLHSRMWRYTSSADLSSVIIAITLVVLLVNGGLFLFNRLEIIPRSVPPMHWALCLVLLCGSRLGARYWFGPGKRRDSYQMQTQHVLIIGASHIGELYIEFARKIIPGQIRIEGVIDENEALRHRYFHQYPILGTPADLHALIEQFRVHGIAINQLILAQPVDSLSSAAKQIIFECERHGAIELVHFETQLGIREKPVAQQPELAISRTATSQTDTAAEFECPTGVYPAIKRGLDVIGAFCLSIVCLPLFLLAALLVYLDVGLPLFFWQQRPGRHGNPFRLYKFRTMRPAGRKHNENRLAHKAGDRHRTSWVGLWIRRLRIDELPQLLHILSGNMSFIGPRPLLSDDQPENGHARLSIRPGITGWAQVNGGDSLTPEEKLVLDLWYIRNMSLWLDIRILMRTLVVIFHKDQPRKDVIADARRKLGFPDESALPLSHQQAV